MRTTRLQKQGLYDPAFEHDACGVGFVADIKGRKSHDIMRQALTVLDNLAHRGGCGCDPDTGDGAGILFQVPDAFFQKECESLRINLPATGQYGVEVRAYNVPIETQPYALAVGGAVGAPGQAGRLTLAKTADPSSEVARGGLLTYTLSVGVFGDPVAGALLSDTLPVSTAFVSASGAYTLSGPGGTVVTWELGELASGQTVTRTLTVNVPPDIPRSATIVNASYQASGAGVAVIDGPPVGVPVQKLKIWLPGVMRSP